MEIQVKLQHTTIATAGLIVASGLAMHVAHAQQQTDIGRTEVQRHDISIPSREVIQVRVDFAPGAAFGKHTHPGEEVAYVLEGTLEYQIEGRGPLTLKAGEALFIPAGAPHTARNVGAGKASELATYILRKGEPPLALVRRD